MRGGNGSGGGDRPCRAASGRRLMLSAVETASREKLATPSAGAAATQVCTHPAIAGWHGPPWQSGQSSQGSDAAVCAGAPLSEGAESRATTGKLAARTAKQPSKAARRRRRRIIVIVCLSSEPAKSILVTVALCRDVGSTAWCSARTTGGRFERRDLSLRSKVLHQRRHAQQKYDEGQYSNPPPAPHHGAAEHAFAHRVCSYRRRASQ